MNIQLSRRSLISSIPAVALLATAYSGEVANALVTGTTSSSKAMMTKGVYKNLQYEKITILSGGPKGGIITKYYGVDGLIPKPATPLRVSKGMQPLEFSKMVSEKIIFNDSAMTNAYAIRGVQIRNGVLLRDFEFNSRGQFVDNGHTRGADAIGIMKDGTAKLYRAWDGDTGQKMINDGVYNSFCFGPALVNNGVPFKIDGDMRYQDFFPVSARQIFGVDKKGQFVLITVDGASSKYGMGMDETAQFAADQGLQIATMLDSGGSAQTVVDGEVTHKSSDSSGYRNVGSVGAINADVDFRVISGVIAHYYENNGGYDRFGAPTSAEISYKDGSYQSFENGYLFNNSGKVYLISTKEIFEKWNNNRDGLGLPIADETDTREAGSYVRFRNTRGYETIACYSNSTGAQLMNARGAIYWHWVNTGSYKSNGYPKHDERLESDGKIHVRFSNGVHLSWTSRFGVRVETTKRKRFF